MKKQLTAFLTLLITCWGFGANANPSLLKTISASSPITVSFESLYDTISGIQAVYPELYIEMGPEISQSLAFPALSPHQTITNTVDIVAETTVIIPALALKTTHGEEYFVYCPNSSISYTPGINSITISVNFTTNDVYSMTCNVVVN
jgi:hypothetical protein